MSQMMHRKALHSVFRIRSLPSSMQNGWSHTRNTLSKIKWGSTRKPRRDRKFFSSERYCSALRQQDSLQSSIAHPIKLRSTRFGQRRETEDKEEVKDPLKEDLGTHSQSFP